MVVKRLSKTCQNVDTDIDVYSQPNSAIVHKVYQRAQPTIPSVDQELPKLELCFCYICLGLYTVWIAISVLRESSVAGLASEYDYYLVNGWSFIARKKDTADWEWSLWNQVVTHLFAINILHISASLLAYKFFYKYRRHVWLSVALLSLYTLVGWRMTLFLIVKCVSMFVVTFFGRVWICWCAGLAWLLALNYQDGTWMEYFLSAENDMSKFSLMYFSIAFSLLRLISFCIERVTRTRNVIQNGGPVKHSLFDLFVSAFYIPTFFTGPIVTYDAFESAVAKEKSSWTPDELWNVVRSIVRGLLCMLVLDFSLHYFYVHSLVMDTEFLEATSLPVLGGIVFVFISVFYMKYLVMYGLPGSFMRIDRLSPPQNPRCIFACVPFSEFWRYFDPGLYKFLTRYVYIPLGGSHCGMLRQIFNVSFTFLFVFFWHGGTAKLFLWSFYNCFGVIIEVIIITLTRTSLISSFLTKWLSRVMRRRIYAFLMVPAYMFCLYSNFVFFTNLETANLLFRRFILKATWFTLPATCFYLYLFTIVNTDIKRRLQLVGLSKTV